MPIRADPIWRPQELLWSPDSKAFVINGSESAYAGDAFLVVHVFADRVVATDVSSAAQRDMVRSFPPCKARGMDESVCRPLEVAPEYNMSAIAWRGGSARVVAIAEIPCGSYYGGIMCQVMGYEVDATTGGVLRRMNAEELKRRYQAQMAWDLRIPARPQYRRPQYRP